MDRIEYIIPGLELDEMRSLIQCATETWGEPGTLKTPPIEGLGDYDIWQREVPETNGNEPVTECVSISRLAFMVHANGIDPESPMGILLARIQRDHPEV